MIRPEVAKLLVEQFQLAEEGPAERRVRIDGCLPRREPLVEMGASPECDVVIADRLVSAFHATLERREASLWFADRGSKNGSILGNKKRREGWIDEGMLLVIGSTPLVAFSARTQAFHRALGVFLGLGGQHVFRVEEAAKLAGSDRHVILVSPKGGEPDRLAELIHRNSPRARKGFIRLDPTEAATKPMQRVALDLATGGCLYIGGSKMPQDPTFLLDSLCHRTWDVRLFAAAIDHDVARRQLGADLCRGIAWIEIPPLAERREEVPQLVQALSRDAIGQEMILNEHDREALTDLACERNLSGLREAVTALAHVSNLGSSRKAATELGVSRSTLRRRLERFGLSLRARPLRPAGVSSALTPWG